MRYVFSRLRREDEERAYRYYLTDCLMILTRNTAAHHGGTYMNRSYSDIVARVKPQQESTEDTVARLIKAVTGGSDEST